MPRSGCLLAAMVSLLLSCTASPAGYDYHSGPDGSGGADRRALEDLNAPEPDGRS
ncbi:MAG: hypothetical protein FJ098_07285, partial [Deltaproteobacteria bacterium]|nr:hypothetical protein [Deltaproteobacteria bacterium]